MSDKRDSNNNSREQQSIRQSVQDAKPLHENWRVDSREERKASHPGSATKPKGR